MKKICFVATISLTIKSFLMDFAEYLVKEHGYEVYFMCDTDDDLPNHLKEGMHYIPVPMKRGISFDGVKVIMRMKKIFECEQFDIIQYATPNAALYASIAANMAGVKNRLCTRIGAQDIWAIVVESVALSSRHWRRLPARTQLLSRQRAFR
ncbi:hypothetical protein NXX53_05315 [Bacteroides salyersiae]|nr:hypothetical protein [Bacteroides salyersiae]